MGEESLSSRKRYATRSELELKTQALEPEEVSLEIWITILPVKILGRALNEEFVNTICRQSLLLLLMVSCKNFEENKLSRT